MKAAFMAITLIMALLIANSAFSRDISFSQGDRDRLIRLETKNEQMDKRLTELREDMNKRFEQMQLQIDKRFEQIDKRFEQIDKRFEQIDKRFEQLILFLGIIAAIFTTMTTAVIGFAYWDRRTIIKKARDDAVEIIEKEGRLKDVINALRELARKNPDVATILRHFNLL